MDLSFSFSLVLSDLSRHLTKTPTFLSCSLSFLYHSESIIILKFKNSIEFTNTPEEKKVQSWVVRAWWRREERPNQRNIRRPNLALFLLLLVVSFISWLLSSSVGSIELQLIRCFSSKENQISPSLNLLARIQLHPSSSSLLISNRISLSLSLYQKGRGEQRRREGNPSFLATAARPQDQ